MATLGDIGVSALINILTSIAFLVAFALLRIQPINDRIYFPKWYYNGSRKDPVVKNLVGKFVNLDYKNYLGFLNWMPQALHMTECDLVGHAGLDSAVFLRVYLLGLKMFVPMMLLALVVLVPVNVSGGTLFFLRKDLVTNNIDKLSISNVPPKSYRFFAHIGMQYLFTFWTCFLLYKEYDRVASMRLLFLASRQTRFEQYTVLVRNVPHATDRSISDSVDQYFTKNHRNTYLCHQAVYNANKFATLVKKRERVRNWLDYYQLKLERNPSKRPTFNTGFFGLWGTKVDSIDFYSEQLNYLDKKLTIERQRILKDPKSVMPVAFVSFNSRWGAAVCAQTQQSKNPTLWLTSWAPEPHDVYWQNLAIPFVSITVRKFVIGISVFALVFFYMIPIAFVQSLANLEALEKVVPFLRPVIEMKFVKSLLQGFLPGLALKLFLYVLPALLMLMSKIEGYVAWSKLERRAADKYYYFMLVNVFLGSLITGTALGQLHAFLHQSPTQIPRNIGVTIPMKATFFITYIMVDGWAGIASEILRLKPLIIFHLKNMLLVKTERDRDRAMNPGSINFPETLPSLQLYFLLGLVYAVVTPILLPFIIVFFLLAFLVYRHQIINVYNQRYESAGGFWPHVHTRIIASLLISQFLLMGLLSTKKASNSTPLLIVLPLVTYAFHKYCKSRFEPAFNRYPLEEATEKDEQEQTGTPDLNLKARLADAYLHPIFNSFEEVEFKEVKVDPLRVDKEQIHVSSMSIGVEEFPANALSELPQSYSHRIHQEVQHHECHSED
ncbi:hypothetical protein vseg_006107 [Gypsophila vaccaria]